LSHRRDGLMPREDGVSRISEQSLENVKAAVDMAELVNGRTTLKKVGARYTGRCPFHDERTPSFSVDPVDKLYFCFGCGAAGDAIRFVQDTENLDFVGAVEWLGDRFGIEIAHAIVLRQTGLRAHAHARAEPAVQLDYNGALERLPALRAGVRQLLQVRDVAQRLELGFGQKPALARLELRVVVLEGADRDVGRAVRPELLDSLPERQ